MFFITNGEYKFDVSKLKEAHSWCQSMVGSWMSDSEELIVISNTFTQEWEMTPYYEWAKDFNYQVHSIIVENKHNGINEHNVPEETLTKMKNRFEIKL